MRNKEKVNSLLRELQNCFNSMYVWRELGDNKALEKASDRVLEIKKEILDLVKD